MRVIVLFIHIYIQLIDTNHVRLQSYLMLYAVYKTFKTTEYIISIQNYFFKDKKGDKVYCLKKKLLQQCKYIFITSL